MVPLVLLEEPLELVLEEDKREAVLREAGDEPSFLTQKQVFYAINIRMDHKEC